MDSQWNPVPLHFIEIIVAKTNGFKLDGTYCNMIYAGNLRSSMTTGSKCRARAFYVSVRIGHMFLREPLAPNSPEVDTAR